MALQAEDPTFLMNILNNRSMQVPAMDCSPVADPRLQFPYYSLDAYQNRKLVSDERIAPQVVNLASASMVPVPNFLTFNGATPGPPVAKTAAPKKKRKSSTQLQKPVAPALHLMDLNQAHGPSAGALPGVVSTGLSLALEDDRSTVTSSCGEGGSKSVHDEFSMQLFKQQEEMKQLLKAQTEQLQQILVERTQMHSKALLATLENEISRRLRDKEEELGRVHRQNTELEERVKHLSLETQFWQSKAKSYEGVASVLRANLQQAMVLQSREHQSKMEGCGDSEAEDAVSVYIDENAQAQQKRATMMMTTANKGSVFVEPLRACKRCRSREVAVLLLPCLHLCLCHECGIDTDRCPVCLSPKSASVEVYLS